MPWEDLNWQSLERLRGAFLDGTAGARDYWLGEEDLDSYDRTFAQRIGWKWDHVLDQLELLRWLPPGGELLDWGCGSGIAARAFLDRFSPAAVSSLRFYDRSDLAARFAANRARAKYPGLTVETGLAPDLPPGLLLLSHVLTELDDRAMNEVLELAHRATAVIWVEPGTFAASRRLIGIRERWRDRFHFAAPCTHRETCGLLRRDREADWCHHFAAPPPGLFADGDWTRFGQLAGIDLRSLPLSYLVADRRTPPLVPPNSFRLLGRPRLQKHQAILTACDAGGVADCVLLRRDAPEACRALKKSRYETLLRGHRQGNRLMNIEWPLLPEDPAGLKAIQ